MKFYHLPHFGRSFCTCIAQRGEERERVEGKNQSIFISDPQQLSQPLSSESKNRTAHQIRENESWPHYLYTGRTTCDCSSPEMKPPCIMPWSNYWRKLQWKRTSVCGHFNFNLPWRECLRSAKLDPYKIQIASQQWYSTQKHILFRINFIPTLQSFHGLILHGEKKVWE